jgi:3-deoxy-D-manno-octulosonic-acid transferase
MFIIYRYIFAPIIWILFKFGAFFIESFSKRNALINEFKTTNLQFSPQKKVLWVHAASMGEFEQAKPIIEYLRSIDLNTYSIIVTFFSPSGYEHQKNYPFADICTYLPIDKHGSMKQFVQRVSPEVVVFIRYEIWPNLLTILSKFSIPYYFVNATFPNSRFWNSIGASMLKSVLSTAEGIYCVNEKEFKKFNHFLGSTNVYVSNDTRIDRIVEKVKSNKPFDLYQLPNKPVIVLGSSWEAETSILASISLQLLEQFHCIIVPHKPEKHTISLLQSQFVDSVLLSHLQKESIITSEIVIVDSVGKLLSLYSIATIAFVGGGFGRCVHSTVEALAYGIPVICGPNIAHSPDATTFTEIELVTIVQTPHDVEIILKKVLDDSVWLDSIRSKSNATLEPSLGESKRIGEVIRKHLL